MEATSKNNRWIWATIVGWLLFGFLIWVCAHYWPEYQRMCANYTAATSENQKFKNENGTLSTENKTLVLTAAEMKERIKNDSILKLQSTRFSKVSSVVSSDQNVKIDTIKNKLPESIPCTFRAINDTVVRKYYSFNYEITPDSLNFSNLVIPNHQTIVVGFKRKNFLSKYYAATEVTNSNPYVITVDMKSATQEVPGSSFWGKAFSFGLGALTGAAIK